MKDIQKQILEAGKDVVGAAGEIQKIVSKTENILEGKISPVRQSILRRFPVLFMGFVTFGLAATFFGIEQILIQYDLLYRYPWLILGLGVGTLMLTGTLYKKLV